MNTEYVLEVLKKSTLEAVNECRGIAKYVTHDPNVVGDRHGIGAYEREDEIAFKAILFNRLRSELQKTLTGAPHGQAKSITLELSVSRKSIRRLRDNHEGNGLNRAKIDIAISDDNPWRDLENENELILIEVKNPYIRNGVMTRKEDIEGKDGRGGIKGDMLRLNTIKCLLPDKVTTVMIVAYIGAEGNLDEKRVRDTILKVAPKPDHLLIC